jgi:hypothetical protein
MNKDNKLIAEAYQSMSKSFDTAKPAATIINGKQVDLSSIEIEGVDTRDYPDFADAFASYATFEDGTELDDEELSELTDMESGLIHDLAHKSFF